MHDIKISDYPGIHAKAALENILSELRPQQMSVWKNPAVESEY